MITRKIDFAAINHAALTILPALLIKWLPDGQARNGEWVARNPTRNDRKPGSFLINMQTGKWADFATGDAGGDVVSLCAYLEGISQYQAAQNLMSVLRCGHA